jgi:hypothetical protein
LRAIRTYTYCNSDANSYANRNTDPSTNAYPEKRPDPKKSTDATAAPVENVLSE